MKNDRLSRRNFIRSTSLAAFGALAGSAMAQELKISEIKSMVTKGRIKQAASRWCYGKIKLDQLCMASAQIGLKGLDLLDPGDFDTLKKHGLVCTMTNTHPLDVGLNDKKNHESCLAKVRDAIEATSEYGFPNVITFPGNRRGIPEDVGVENSVEALKQVAGLAEKKKVNICLEYLNSKVNHADYMFDNIAWGVEVCKRVGSDRVKILYDIYHAQIMEGDIIRTIQNNHQYIAHYHTGGNPGRNEIDETQEIYYPAIMRAIAETGYQGYVAHEFVPKRDPLTSLAEAVKLCDV